MVVKYSLLLPLRLTEHNLIQIMIMKRMAHQFWRAKVAYSGLLLILMSLASCTVASGDEVVGDVSESNMPPMTILIGEDAHAATRGAYQEGKDMTEYAVYSFNSETKKTWTNNSVLTKNADGTWSRTKEINFPDQTTAIDIFAMKPGFKGHNIEKTKMLAAEKSILYTVPNKNYLQEDFMFSSLMNQTMKGTNNIIQFNFRHMFSYLRFKAKLSNEEIDVTIHSIVLHNLKAKGKFTLSNDVANEGEWALEDVYDDYEFVLPKDSILTYNATRSLHIDDSTLFVLPQNPDLFKMDASTKFSYADSLNQTYVEILCKVVKKNSGVEIGNESDGWAHVYYPVKTAKWSSTKYPFGGSFTLTLTFTGGYTYDGEDFLSRYTGGLIENTSVEGVKGGIISEEWEDDTANSGTITL